MKKFKDGLIKVLCASLCVCIVLLGGCSCRQEGLVGCENLFATVVLDAGHGGIDGGVSGVNSGEKESKLNLQICLALKDYFESGGIRVVMTRKGQGGLYGLPTKGFKKRDMERRMGIINGANADLLISVHLNFYTSPTRRGAQVFYNGDSQSSKTLAQGIQKNLNSSSGQPKEFDSLRGDYFVLNVANCPAALVECGFLSSPEDEELLLTEKYRREIAYLIYKGSIEYLLSSK